jgi:hypothetical protein
MDEPTLAKFCPHCGATAAGGRFCASCGGDLALLPPATSPTASTAAAEPQEQAPLLGAGKTAHQEWVRQRDEALGTNSATNWPECSGCKKRDGWYPVGQPRLARLPRWGRYGEGWGFDSARPTAAVQRFACVHCGLRSDLLRVKKQKFDHLNAEPQSGCSGCLGSGLQWTLVIAGVFALVTIPPVGVVLLGIAVWVWWTRRNYT